jgi:hypothetical protein
MSKQEFYIGWMGKAPATIAGFIKKYLLFLLVTIVVLGSLLAMNQKKFSKANFEFGKTTVVKGIYVASPVPHLLVRDQNDYVVVPLVGYGKHGAVGVMNALEVERKDLLNGKEIRLKGTLLYGDGKILMQVDKNDDPLVTVARTTHRLPVIENDEGEVNLVGEIIDPKCYFGVMKPGEGKVHKDCAIRCILGGIPPVLKITNDKGENSYVLLTGDNINERVKDFVATPSQVSGHLKKYNDWEILEVRSIDNIRNDCPVKKLSSLECKTDCCKKM